MNRVGAILLNLLILLSLGDIINSSYLEYDGWLNIELYHSLDMSKPDTFLPRGNISVTSLNTGSVSAAQHPLSSYQKNSLKDLAKNQKFYRLKAVVVTPDGTKTTYLTSSKACSLVNSQLSDVLWVSLDHLGAVLSITESVYGDSNCDDLQSSDMDALEEFNTDIYIKHMELAVVPDTASFIQKVEREREARERGETKDNRGFFAKYWMYIVPVGIFVLISGATNPDGGANAGAGR